MAQISDFTETEASTGSNGPIEWEKPVKTHFPDAKRIKKGDWKTLRHRSVTFHYVVTNWNSDWSEFMEDVNGMQSKATRTIFKCYCKVWFAKKHHRLLTDAMMYEAFPQTIPHRRSRRRCCVHDGPCDKCMVLANP